MEKTDRYKNKLEYNNQYNRNNYRSFSIRFNINDEHEIISRLESQESIKSYITALILNDIKKSKES